MRTTLTLDDDVASLLRRRAQETGRPFRDVVNDAIRAGLEQAPASLDGDLVPTYALGLRPGIDIVRARHLAVELEDAEHARRLERRQ